MRIDDVTIIGGGIAGISCAVQLTRYGIKPSIFEKRNLGGLLLNANLIENYPGFPEGISGIELINLLKNQLIRNKIEALFEEVLDLQCNKEKIEIKTEKKIYISEFAVIATGTKPKKFKDFVIPKEIKSKIFYEVHKIRTVKNKKITIVGGGDAAFDYALNLAKANNVIILNRNKSHRCIPILFEREENSSKINYMKNTRINNISSSGNTIKIECITAGKTLKIKTDYLLFAIGRTPCLDFLSEELKEKSLKQNANNRLYLAGDVKNGIFRQASIAAGDGIKTAMQIYKQTEKGDK
jgi:thioredoxin reductase